MANDIRIDSTTDSLEQVESALAGDNSVEEVKEESPETPQTEGQPDEDEGEEDKPENPEEVVEDEDEEDDDSEEDEEDEEPEEVEDRPRKRPSKQWHRRVNKLTAIRRQQAEEIDRLRQENESLKSSAPKTEIEQPKLPDYPEPKPSIDDYDTVEEWTEALTDWKANKAIFDLQAKNNAEREAAEIDRRNREQNAVMEAHVKRTEEFRKQYPDFDKVRQRARDEQIPITPLMVEHIMHSDFGPHLTYHLAKNPDVCRRIAAMPAGPQLVALGELQAELKRKNNKSVNKSTRKAEPPPPPIKPVRRATTTTSTKPVEQMTQREYNEWRSRGGGKR